MFSFVIDEEVLRELSPTARRELLQVLRSRVQQLRADFAHVDWNPESNVSYPLTVDEARALVRDLPEAVGRLLRVFARHFDGEVGRGELDELMRVAGHDHYDQLGQDVAALTLTLRSITGHADAWLLNWNTQDWVWNEENGTYERGAYFISGPAIHSLRVASGVAPPSEAEAVER